MSYELLQVRGLRGLTWLTTQARRHYLCLFQTNTLWQVLFVSVCVVYSFLATYRAIDIVHRYRSHKCLSCVASQDDVFSLRFLSQELWPTIMAWI